MNTKNWSNLKVFTLMLITTLAIVLIINFSSGLLREPKVDDEPIDEEIIDEDRPFGQGEFTGPELELLNSIRAGKNTITINEWINVAPGLLEKIIVKSGINHADYLNNYKERSYNFIIRELDKLNNN